MLPKIYLHQIEGADIAGTIFMEDSPGNWRAQAPFATISGDFNFRLEKIAHGFAANAIPEKSQLISRV